MTDIDKLSIILIMKELIVENIKIENLIFEIGGKQVMLDSDLAKIYECKNGTKEINQVVKNNLNKFPERFSWILTKEESSNFLVKIFDQKIEKRGGKYYNPRVFTEQGVAMLATILKTDVATSVSIAITDAFVVLRKYISSNNYVQRISNIETKLIEHNNKIEVILNKFENKEINNHIFFEGQIYDAYSLMMNILNKAKKEIIIIDNYAGRELFDLIKNINICIKIYTKNIDNEASKKYLKQYNNIKIINTDIFHDRFIVIDKKTLYHCGSSFKDLGKKCFAITKMEDKEILDKLIRRFK